MRQKHGEVRGPALSQFMEQEAKRYILPFGDTLPGKDPRRGILFRNSSRYIGLTQPYMNRYFERVRAFEKFDDFDDPSPLSDAALKRRREAAFDATQEGRKRVKLEKEIKTDNIPPPVPPVDRNKAGPSRPAKRDKGKEPARPRKKPASTTPASTSQPAPEKDNGNTAPPLGGVSLQEELRTGASRLRPTPSKRKKRGGEAESTGSAAGDAILENLIRRGLAGRRRAVAGDSSDEE